MCQLCNFDCYDLFKKLKAVTPPERLQLLYNSAFKATDALLQDPKQGLLWQVCCCIIQKHADSSFVCRQIISILFQRVAGSVLCSTSERYVRLVIRKKLQS